MKQVLYPRFLRQDFGATILRDQLATTTCYATPYKASLCTYICIQRILHFTFIKYYHSNIAVIKRDRKATTLIFMK